MKLPLVLAVLLVGSLALAVTPTANAGHCAQYPVVQEVVCTADHAITSLADICFYTTPPSQWYTDCLA